MILHHQLTTRTEIRGYLLVETGLHSGSSVETGTTNASIIRDAFGKPYIPGSSLKGALRSRVEALAHGLTQSPVCFLERTQKQLFDNNDEPAQPQACLSTYRDGATWVQREAKAFHALGDGPRLSRNLANHLCPACQLFGGPSWRAKLALDDLILLEGAAPLTEIRDGVGLDRDRRTAVPGVKYDFEALPPGTRFQFACTAENLEALDWQLLAAGLLELCHGHLPLGGKVTRGLGSVRLESEALTITHTDFRQAQVCQAFFGQVAQQPEPDPLSFLQNKISPTSGA